MGKEKLTDYFGCDVFNEAVMKERLPQAIFEGLLQTRRQDLPLTEEIATAVANAMKEWAIEKGATHFTHWFQPMTGITAEKHDSFLTPAEGGKVMMEFSAKELIKGEPDASSFPSGGLRATFEARGYTTWDPTSDAFVKDGSLYIPTAFCSYSGEVLDKKTPLLRSMEALNREALRVLKYLEPRATHVYATVGAEQEYFIVDKALYLQREDLIFTGHTLFGAHPPKGQELSDHYFGNIKERINRFMQEVDETLWRLGVCSKTKHNEVAPAQHELAPIFSNCNVAADQNQLTMEVLKKVADHHGLVCLLHEKPFAGFNGSGKHNNWALCTDTGLNLLNPGKDPIHNDIFLVFLSAVIKAVDEYGDMLRLSCATAANDYRLGGHEAPPSIISMFLGEEITAVLTDYAQGVQGCEHCAGSLQTGVHSLAVLSKDGADRNRTSPFAFTGNKFEFRMVGANQSISGINITINTMVADALCTFANRLDAAQDPKEEIKQIITESVTKHGRIIFNGNNYSQEWVQEAQRRGLPHFKNAVEALVHFRDKKNIDQMVRMGIFTETEVLSRCDIMLDDYANTINIEARTMVDMAQKQIFPAVMQYAGTLCQVINQKAKAGISALKKEKEYVETINRLTEELLFATESLQAAIPGNKNFASCEEKARYFAESVKPKMEALRTVVDRLEVQTAKKDWPMPTYADLMFMV